MRISARRQVVSPLQTITVPTYRRLVARDFVSDIIAYRTICTSCNLANWNNSVSENSLTKCYNDILLLRFICSLLFSNMHVYDFQGFTSIKRCYFSSRQCQSSASNNSGLLSIVSLIFKSNVQLKEKINI